MINLSSDLEIKIEDFSKIWGKSSQIPGYITKNEGLLLYSLARNYGAFGDIVEIGSYQGRSSVILGKALKNSGNLDRKIICVDDFSKQESSTFPDAGNPKSELIKNMEYFDLTDIFVLEEEDGSKALEKLDIKSCGLIFIDSDHSAEQISKEFPLALNAIDKSGLILIHDYKNPNVSQDYSSWISNNIKTQFNTLFFQDSTPKYGGNGLLIVDPN